MMTLCFNCLKADVLYVDKDAAAGGDGSSWTSAYRFLNQALDYADKTTGVFDIWIAEGTYYTDEGDLYSNDDQNSRFTIPSTVVSVLGGFSGIELSADDADPAKYLTTLSGLIFEEYGATGIGSSYLIQTEAGASSLLVKGFTIANSSDLNGCLISITDATDRSETTFEQCNFHNNVSTQTLIVTSTADTVLFRNCRFENCQTSGGYLIQHGNFESCYFNQNNSLKAMLFRPGTVDRCFITDNTTTSTSRDSDYSLIHQPENVFNSLFCRNVAGGRAIIVASNTQLLHSTFIDNYNYDYNYAEISGSVTVGNCLFFRSGLNRSPILDSATVGYKSTVNLPVQSAFFGVFDYYQSWSSSSTNNSDTLARFFNMANQNPYAGTSVFESGFFKTFEAVIPSSTEQVPLSVEQLNGATVSEYFTSLRSMHGRTLCWSSASYTPELTPIMLPDLVIPDPFVNYSDPLGPDGQPFTEDDGLRLNPDSQWATEVINVTTITADYESYDILGNPRIVGSLVDLGAYEYKPLQDADGDGISDANDAFPNNPAETLDTDNDGLGDNADSDDDGDGVDDSVEIAAGTDPKQYTSAFYNFVQTLGAGAYDAGDLVESRLAGQSDVTSDPTSFNLHTPAELSTAEATARSLGQGDVTTDPNTYGLYSASDLATEQSTSRSLGQQDVVDDPLNYGLYSPSHVTGLLDSSRAAGRIDVISDPTSYDLYTQESIMDLHLGGLILQPNAQGGFDFQYTIQTSADLSTWSTHSQPSVTVGSQAGKQFLRIRME